MGKIFKTLHKLRPEPLPICTIHAFKFPHCLCPHNLPQSRSHKKWNVIKGKFNKTEDSKLFTQVYTGAYIWCSNWLHPLGRLCHAEQQMLPRSKQTETDQPSCINPNLVHHKGEHNEKKSHPESITGVTRVLLVRIDDGLNSRGNRTFI